MLTFSRITDVPTWEKMKDEWNQLHDQSQTRVPFLRHEFLRHWWDTCGGGEWDKGKLEIVLAHDGDKLVGIAPLFFTIRKDGRRSLMFLGSFEIVDYLDVIVIPEYLDPFLLQLLAYLTTSEIPEWDEISLYNILDESATLESLKKAARQVGWSYEEKELQKAPFICLTGNWDTYLAGIDKKQRHEIRRKMRRADEAEQPVSVYVTREAEKLDADIHSFLELMAYDEEKKQFLTPKMTEQMENTLRCAFDTGCLHLAFLEIGGVKAAAYMSFDYLHRLWVYNSGLNPAFNAYSPGWVLLGHLLKWANENQYSEFDFLRGDEEYKYRFGAVDRRVYRVRLKR